MTASPQAPSTSFDRRMIGNAIAIDSVGSPGRIKELDFRFKEYWRVWERKVRDLEEEVRRLRCKVKED